MQKNNYVISNKMASMKPSMVREILKASSDPGTIALSAGNPAPEAFPVSDIKRIANDIFDTDPVLALQYGVTEGYAPLTEKVIKINEKNNVGKDFDRTIITTGAQQAIDLLVKSLVN